MGDPRDELAELRRAKPRASRDAGAGPDSVDGFSPDTVTGWWCHRCGNVDMPQPCLGVCVWRPAYWVERQRLAAPAGPGRAGAASRQSLRHFVARAAAVSPRRGQWARNREALLEQARAALADPGKRAKLPA